MYKHFFHNYPLASFAVDTHGKLRAYNKPFLESVGYDRSHDLLKDSNFIFHDMLSNFDSIVARLLKDEPVVEFETYIKRKDNSFDLVKINCAKFIDENSNQLVIGTLAPVQDKALGIANLADERRKYEDILNNSVQLIQSFDKNGQLLFVNKAWRDTFGYHNDDILAINLFDIIAEEDKAHCNEIFQNIIKGIPAYDIRVHFISKSGKQILLNGNALPMLINGELVATHAFFKDISELDVVKKELASKDILLQTIFKAIPASLYLKNVEGEYVFANETMKQTIGVEVIGKKDTDIFDAENATIMRKADLEALTSESQSATFTFAYQRNESKQHFFCAKKPIITDDNQKLIFGYSVDITELKDKTNKIEENERILNQIVSNTNTGIMLFKFDKAQSTYKIDFINNTCKNIIGYTDSKTEFSQLLPEIYAKHFEAGVSEITKNQQYDFTVNLADKMMYYDIYIHQLALPDENNKLLVFFNDVTEKRNMIESLESKLKENLVLLGEVHHRVKNNLANIYGIIELNKYKFQETNYEKYIIEIQLKIKCIALVHELLYKSKSISCIPMDQYFTELCNDCKQIYKIHKLVVNFDLDLEKNITIELDKAINIGLMLGELISNSISYASNNNQVSIGISLKVENGRYYFQYMDSGHGFEIASENNTSKGYGLRLIKNVLKKIKANYSLNTDKQFLLSFDFDKV